MRKILFTLAIVFPILVFGQTPTENYIKTTIFQSVGSNGVPPQISVTYFDGLGRPIQQVVNKQTGNLKDIITPIEYDDYGRQPREYLPFISSQNTLGYLAGAKSLLLPQYQEKYQDSIAYSQKEFEASPLNRVLKQAAPGQVWKLGNGHEVVLEYQTNTANEVRLFGVSLQSDYTPTIIDNNAYYPENKLYKTITYDENNHAVKEFKDLQGRVVLKRTFGTSMVEGVLVNSDHDTYYVYDDYGNLTYVIPPLVDLTHVVDAQLAGLCYQYQYDYRNRLIAKKLPGKRWEYIVYNNQDKPVATGPAANPWGVANSWGWLITKYDAFGRVAYTGWMENGSIDGAERNSFEGQLGNDWAESFSTTPSTIDGISLSYTKNISPTDFKLLTINYYDRYDYVNGPTLPTAIEGEHVLTNTKGLSTGSWVRILDGPSSTKAEVSYTLYDKKGRAIATSKTNHFGGYTQTQSKLDFTGKPLYTKTLHRRAPNNGEEVRVTDTFEYDAQGLLMVHKQKVNNQFEELISKNTYDALGQLMSKQVGGEDVTTYVGLQKVDYKYNIRGWLKNINNIDSLQVADTSIPKDLFAFKINYDDADSNSSPLFNGNIAETFWKTSTDNKLRKYGYQYDELNRLNKAIYQKPNSLYPVTHMYDEELTYDKNGNIKHLNRYGDLDDPTATNAVQLDDLTYVYDNDNRNQLVKVTDASGHPKGFLDDTDGTSADTNNDYAYDANGNLTSDENKKINTISYNHLNLPVKITFSNSGNIEYLYNALGQKVMKKVDAVGPPETTVVTDYLDGFQYSNGALKFFPHAEGYVNATQVKDLNNETHNRFNYVYNYLDHLGNVRVSYGYDQNAQMLKILEQNHYYPFGLKHTRYNVELKKYDVELDPDGNPFIGIVPDVGAGDGRYKYKFGNKELQDELGLNVYDFEARNYDPAIGRWMNIDPLAEKGRRWSPYCYAMDNPVYFIDPDGMWPLPSWNNVKSFVSSTGNGVVKQLKAIGGTVASAPARLAKAYSSPTEALKMMASPYKMVAEMVASNVTTGTNIAKKLVNGDVKGAGEAYGAHLTNGAVALATMGAGKLATPKATVASEGSIANAGEVSAASKLQNAANEASTNVGEGSGAVHGTKVHSEFAKIAGDIENITTEVSYKNGEVVPYGTKGSVRADAVEGDINNPTAIYDLKTGGAKLTNANIENYNQNVPGSPPVNEIKPNN